MALLLSPFECYVIKFSLQTLGSSFTFYLFIVYLSYTQIINIRITLTNQKFLLS